MPDVLKALIPLFPEPWLSIVVAVVSLVLVGGNVLFKFWRDLGDYHHSVRVKRPLELVTQLFEAAPPATDLAAALQRRRETEIFAIAFGVRASPARVAALTRMYNTGLFSPSALRIVAPFVEGATDEAVHLVINRGHRWLARVSILVMAVVTVYFLLLVFQAFLQGTAAVWFVVLIFGVVWFAAMLYFGRDVRALYVAEDAERHLAKIGLLAPAD